MADFICEERRSSRAPAMLIDGFIAEMRPSSRRGPPSHCTPTEEETALKVYYEGQDGKDSDQSLMKLLSNKSKKEYTNILTNSIITLVQTLLTGHDIATIEGSLQVSFHGVELPIQVRVNESFSSGKKDYLLDLENDIGIRYRGDRSPSFEMSSDGDHCQCNDNFIPDLGNRDDISSVASSPPRTEQMITDCVSEQAISTSREGEAICLITRDVSPPKIRERAVALSHESGEESGYSTTDRDDVSDGNRCASPTEKKTPDQGNVVQAYVFGPNVSSGESRDHDDVEFPLIIDMNNPLVNDSEEAAIDKEHRPDESDSYNHISPFTKLRTKERVSSSSSDDGDINLPLTYSDDTDSDVHMDLSGDCKIIEDSEIDSTEKVNKTESSPSFQPFKCKVCSHLFPDVNSLSKHALGMHQVYTCHHCSRIFTAKNNLKRHTRIHTGLRPYKCSQCSTTFARRDDLKGHQLRHDYNKPFRCSLCKKGYTDRACVKNHMVKEHGSRLMYVCPQCGESFDREDVFSRHKKTHPELRQYACDICPFIGSNNLMACKHSLVHTRKLFSCKPCNAYFADPFGYTDHIRKHKKNESFTNYVCCFCDITLPTYEQFVRHEYSHAHCKSHICHTCNKQFRSKALLQEHVQSHNESPDSTSHQRQTCEISSTEDSNIVETPVENDCSDRPKDDITSQMEENAEDKHMNIQEEVLDLTMTKPVISSESNRCITNTQSFSNGQEKMSTFDVPRNGCVTELSSPSEEDYALRCVAELPTRIVSRDIDQSNEANFNAAWRNKSHQRESVESVTSGRQIPGVNDQLESMVARNLSPFDKALPSSVIHKAPHQLKVDLQQRYTPYLLPSQAAELASKFILARGRAPFISSSEMKDINKGFRPLMKEQKELVIQKDVTGKPSIRIVARPLPANPTYSTNGWEEGKENACLKTLHIRGNDIENGQTPSIVYGLTGKEYRKESPISSPSFQASETSNIPFPYIKAEPLDPNNPSLESILSDNIPESVSPPAAITSPKADTNTICDICSQAFECFPQLESHSVITHKRYLCEYCGKGFTSRPNRDRHVRYHTGERPYKCDLCDTAFHRGDDLKYHRTTRHPEAAPFVCTHCSATFTWKRDLDRHIRHSKCKN